MKLRNILIAAALGTAAISATVFAAAGSDGGHEGGGPGFGAGMFMGGGHHGRDGAHGAMNPERMAKRVDRMTERLIKSVDGTPEQRDQIGTIAKAAAEDLMNLRKQSGDLRGKAMDLLKAPTIDRAAIETLRTEQMATMDAMTKRTTTALADVAEVLTPEQRTKLAERMSKRRGGGERHGRGRHGSGEHQGGGEKPDRS